METSSASNFRFRDHGNDMENGESVIGDTSSELSSVTSDEESDVESDELASMTAKGINHLCLELMELKQASEFDFQDNIISNYTSFIRVFRETEGINNEVMQLQHHLIAHKKLVRNLTDGVDLKTILINDPTDTVLDESDLNDQNPTTLFKNHANEVLETLDNLLFEHRLEEAIEVFKIEDSNSPKVKLQEDISPDIWMCYKSDMAERRVHLADKLTLMADNSRISAAELQKILVGLSRLGFDHLATRLLFKYYHNRITLGEKRLQSSVSFPPGIYIHDLAKHVFSMISQASNSFVKLYGETSVYDSELTKWAREETEFFADWFNKHIKSVSQIGGGLSTVVDSVHFATSFCSILESQNLVLQPCLIDHIVPCLEGILKGHFGHFKKVISIFTCSDVWIMGRYLVSGMFKNGSSSSLMGFDQYSEYCLLTNSGRKFVSLLQSVMEDVSSLVSISGSSILKELMDLYTHYISILEKALICETNDILEDSSRTKTAESLSQKVSIISNLSTLGYFFSIMIKNLFKDMNQLKNVIEDHVISVADTCSRLKTRFCKQFVHRLMSNEASCVTDHADFDLMQRLAPSVPYQILFLEIRKVEELADDSVVEFDWLASLLTKVIETTFDYISKNHEIWMSYENEETTNQKSDRLNQFAVDMQFLVEIARHGGYLTVDMVNYSTNLVSEMESVIISEGFDLNRYVVDYEKVANSVKEAIRELGEQKWQSDDDDINGFDDASEENQSHSCGDNSIEEILDDNSFVDEIEDENGSKTEHVIENETFIEDIVRPF